MEEYKKLTGSKKFIVSNPLPLKKLPTNKEYSVTLKLDGIRYMLFVTSKRDMYLVTRNMKFIEIKEQEEHNIPPNSLFDGELYNNSTYYIFDVIYMNEVDVSGYSLLDRYSIYSNIKSKDNGGVISIKPKRHYFASDRQDLYKISRKLISKSKMDNDGLIFTPMYGKEIYKWKPIITIDLKIKKQINNKWKLYASNNRIFKTIRVSNKENEKYLDGDIVEFKWNNKRRTLVPIKLREDKTDGNYYKVALDNFNLMNKPIKLYESII
jgi:hypothetical protein